ncbi:MAG: TlpA disulfide reductase family protein [Rhodocyclaceae bacterium]|nr:TlpA disulfide reductase family protein [Rhodocyclaceae bacterium]
MKHILPILALFWNAALALAAPPGADGPPQVGTPGREGFQEYRSAPTHRAFAIAPGGAWGWSGGEANAEAASSAALAQCREHSDQNCLVYDLDGKKVFEAQRWPTLWGPYLGKADAARKAVGTEIGLRFPDLVFHGPRPSRLSDLRGKVVVLHFWGTWCAPCRHELPELEKLQKLLGAGKDIQLVLVPVREDIADSRRWLERQHLNLPLYDAQARGAMPGALSGTDGKTLNDRDLAAVFPTSFVLDRHGIVIFSHRGPIADWPDYLPFLKDASAKSGR